jgi:hypothetical protein
MPEVATIGRYLHLLGSKAVAFTELPTFASVSASMDYTINKLSYGSL